MGIFACFNLGARPAARRVHAKAGTEAVDNILALPKIDTDVPEAIPEAQGTHIAESKLGKPFDVDKLGPCLPPDNEARLDTVSCVLEAAKDPDPALTPILQLLCKILHTETACVTMIVENGVQMQQGTGLMTEKTLYPQPGVCHWMLVPDRPQAMIVEDMHLDARTCTRAVVTEAPHMRFYASAPLVASNGHILGTLCIWDTKPRAFDSHSAAILANFAELVVREIEMHAVLRRQLSVAHMLKRAMDCYQQGYLFVDASSPGWRIMHVNQAFSSCTGMTREQAVDASFWDVFQTPSSDVKEPWSKHEAALAEKRPFQLNALRCTAETSPSDKTYSAVVRPASTDKVDEDALLIGIPAGSFSREALPRDDSYFFVVLRAPQEPFRRPLPSPVQGLKLGPQLGAGTQGRVYRATLEGEPVAVKVVDNASTLRKMGTMPLEAALLQDMKHDCIVNLLKHKFVTSSQQERQLWLVMEFCDKGPLDVAIDKGLFRTAPSPKAQACMETILQTALELAEGLAFLHSRCLVHCDLSGGNILLRSDPSRPHGFATKISDFGMCRIKDMDVVESLQGTYSHMAPEVIQNQDFSEASDVYAFGVLLWEMYNGQRAWAGLLFAQLSYAMFVEKRSLQFPQDTPEGFRALALSCMSTLPADRPSSKDLPTKLNALLAQHEV